MNEEELKRKEQELQEREAALNEREKKLDPFSAALQAQKYSWYEKIPLNLRQMNHIVWAVYGLLAIVAVLIILEATGVFKIGG